MIKTAAAGAAASPAHVHPTAAASAPPAPITALLYINPTIGAALAAAGLDMGGLGGQRLLSLLTQNHPAYDDGHSQTLNAQLQPDSSATGTGASSSKDSEVDFKDSDSDGGVSAPSQHSSPSTSPSLPAPASHPSPADPKPAPPYPTTETESSATYPNPTSSVSAASAAATRIPIPKLASAAPSSSSTLEASTAASSTRDSRSDHSRAYARPHPYSNKTTPPSAASSSQHVPTSSSSHGSSSHGSSSNGSSNSSLRASLLGSMHVPAHLAPPRTSTEDSGIVSSDALSPQVYAPPTSVAFSATPVVASSASTAAAAAAAAAAPQMQAFYSFPATTSFPTSFFIGGQPLPPSHHHQQHQLFAQAQMMAAHQQHMHMQQMQMRYGMLPPASTAGASPFLGAPPPGGIMFATTSAPAHYNPALATLQAQQAQQLQQLQRFQQFQQLQLPAMHGLATDSASVLAAIRQAGPQARPQHPQTPVRPGDRPACVGDDAVKWCTSCYTTDTPMWRDSPVDGQSLCNACGIRYRKYGQKCLNCLYIPRKHERTSILCARCCHFLPNASKPAPGPVRGSNPAPALDARYAPY